MLMTAPQLLRENAAAVYLDLSPKTLNRWRWAGKGPNYTTLGGAARYLIADLDSFISKGKVER